MHEAREKALTGSKAAARKVNAGTGTTAVAVRSAVKGALVQLVAC
jgi:hypothetical protein